MATRDSGEFDPQRPVKEAGAQRRNWRPYYYFGACLAFVLVVYLIEPSIWQNIWGWWKEEDVERFRERPALDTGPLEAFPHGEPPTRTVEREVPVPVPQIVERRVQVPTPAPAPPPSQIVTAALPRQTFWPAQSPQPPATMVDGRQPIKAWGCAIRRGQEIKAELAHDVRWDRGGQIVATVTEDVFSPEAFYVGERRVLVPFGARLIGYVDDKALRRGDDLAPAPVWQFAEFIDSSGNPRSISLHAAQGADAAGRNAVGGEVDARWGEILAVAALSTVFDVIGNTSVNIGSDTNRVILSGSPAARIGERVTEDLLQWRPRIFTPRGTTITLRANQAIRVCD